jgi:hypothetical protein
MNKIFTLRCPKEHGKRYFSLAQHQYKNNLSVVVNDHVLFKNIDDAEENLPITLSDQILFDTQSINVISLIYDIKFGTVEEKTEVDFIFDPNSSVCTAKFNRKNFVVGSEKLTDEYKITLTMNDQTHTLDKTFHQGKNKTVSVQNFMDLDLPIKIKLESKKQFENQSDITYDQLEFEIQ